jgi:hypothetical protein
MRHSIVHWTILNSGALRVQKHCKSTLSLYSKTGNTSRMPYRLIGLLTRPGGCLTIRGLSLIVAGETYMAHWTPIPQPRCRVLTTISKPSRSLRLVFLSFADHEPLLHPISMHLELGELLGSLAASGKDAEDIEADGLGEGPALADDDLVTGLDTESGGDVCGEVLVAPLVTGVLGDEVKVFTADDQGAYSSLVPTPKPPLVFFFVFCARLRGLRDDVRCILVDMTVPVRIRPRIETIPVNGHFLSM